MTRFLPTAFLASSIVMTAALFAAPAHADRVSSEAVTLTFDRIVLQAPAGVSNVLSDLERQARKACTTIEPVLRAENIDDDCVVDVLEQAVQKIDDSALTAAFQRSDYLALRIDEKSNKQG